MLGPGIVPAVLSKYRAACGLLIAGLCAAAALFDLARRRWLGGLVWLAAAAVLFAGFESSRLWGGPRTVLLGWLAIVLALGGMLETLLQELRTSLASARRERRSYRRIRPGVSSTERRD